MVTVKLWAGRVGGELLCHLGELCIVEDPGRVQALRVQQRSLKVVGQELGVVGVFALMFLYGLIAYAGLRAAKMRQPARGRKTSTTQARCPAKRAQTISVSG